VDETNLGDFRLGNIQLDVTAIPELDTYTLLAGLTGLVYVMLRRRR
jgi:hypothetical protein